jgi:hypothetical protein
MSETSASEFWSELPIILEAAEELEDADAAAMLIEFLEDHKQTWQAIVTSMRESADRRRLFERAVRVLEGKETGG